MEEVEAPNYLRHFREDAPRDHQLCDIQYGLEQLREDATACLQRRRLQPGEVLSLSEGLYASTEHRKLLVPRQWKPFLTAQLEQQPN
jgi:hypothetical protein